MTMGPMTTVLKPCKLRVIPVVPHLLDDRRTLTLTILTLDNSHIHRTISINHNCPSDNFGHRKI